MLNLDTLPRIPCRDRRPRTEPPTSICLHVPVSQEWAGAAEAVARFLQNPPSTAGIHFTVDNDSEVMCADPRTETVPHCYRPSGWSIGIEIAGTIQSARDWDDDFSRVTLKRTAALVATLCRTFDIPVVRLSPLEVAGKGRGIFDHFDATHACQFMGWPQDGHVDVGPEFPWGGFLAMVEAELNPEEDLLSGLVFEVGPILTGALTGRWCKVRPELAQKRLRCEVGAWEDGPGVEQIPAYVTSILHLDDPALEAALGHPLDWPNVSVGQSSADPHVIVVHDKDGDYAFRVA